MESNEAEGLGTAGSVYPACRDKQATEAVLLGKVVSYREAGALLAVGCREAETTGTAELAEAEGCRATGTTWAVESAEAQSLFAAGA